MLIVGSGWVGRQVAANLAQAGVRVDLSDVSVELIEDALNWVRAQPDWQADSSAPVLVPEWRELAEPGPILKDITQEHELAKNVDLVVECVPEQLSIKKRILKKLSSVFPPRTLIASNSSYFVPSLLSTFVDGPERFAHLHFHVPVLKRSVVDVCGCEQTSVEALDALEELAMKLGHKVLRLRNEHPGYVFNWLLQSLLKSALELVAKGVVEPDEVDLAWKTITQMPQGPFGMMDHIGLDVIEQVLSNARWSEEAPVSYQELIDVIRPHIAAGNVGVKSGQGFYRYDDT